MSSQEAITITITCFACYNAGRAWSSWTGRVQQGTRCSSNKRREAVELDREGERGGATQGGRLRQGWTARAHAAAAAGNK
jgi:hypothetical protein